MFLHHATFQEASPQLAFSTVGSTSAEKCNCSMHNIAKACVKPKLISHFQCDKDQLLCLWTYLEKDEGVKRFARIQSITEKFKINVFATFKNYACDEAGFDD